MNSRWMTEDISDIGHMYQSYLRGSTSDWGVTGIRAQVKGKAWDGLEPDNSRTSGSSGWNPCPDEEKWHFWHLPYASKTADESSSGNDKSVAKQLMSMYN
jgi:hypothetical protein